MKRFKYFLFGFKNTFSDNISGIKSEYPIYDLWEKSNKINDKLKAINEKIKENIKRHIYSTY